MEHFACSVSAVSISPLRELGSELPPLFPLVDDCGLPTISADVLKKIITGEQGCNAESVVIIDSRHNYEYAGGHIKGAINLSDPSSIEDFYTAHIDKGKHLAIIFHCEFSSARAPKLFSHMRNIDRVKHMATYPELAFPNMFLLQGGYKAFFEQHPELCEPREYIKMSDPKYLEQLRFAATSMKKSWAQRTKGPNGLQSCDHDGPLLDVSNVLKSTETTTSSCSLSLSFGR